jgi:hypothetical protein
MHQPEEERDAVQVLEGISPAVAAEGRPKKGNGNEMGSNRQKDMELSMLTLHLLQICLVYVNTLMIQQILAERSWAKRLTKEDLRALTPLIYAHVNPYGIFLLDMRAWLSIESTYKTAA